MHQKHISYDIPCMLALSTSSTYSAFMMKTMHVRDREWGYSIIAWTIDEFPWKKAGLDVMQSPTVQGVFQTIPMHIIAIYFLCSWGLGIWLIKVIRFFNFKVIGLFLYSRSSWKSSTKWTRKTSSKLKHGTVNSTGQTENRRRHGQRLCDTICIDS